MVGTLEDLWALQIPSLTMGPGKNNFMHNIKAVELVVAGNNERMQIAKLSPTHRSDLS